MINIVYEIIILWQKNLRYVIVTRLYVSPASLEASRTLCLHFYPYDQGI